MVRSCRGVTSAYSNVTMSVTDALRVTVTLALHVRYMEVDFFSRYFFTRSLVFSFLADSESIMR